MKISIGTKLWAGFISILLVLLVVGGSAYRSTTRLADNGQWVSHTHEVLAQLAELMSTLRAAETGQRGYVITGEDEYLEPYRQAVQSADSLFRELNTLTADNPAQQRRLLAMLPMMTEKFSVMKDTIELRKSKGFEAARQFVTNDRGKKLMNDLNLLVLDMTRQEQELLKQRDDEARLSAQSTIITIIGGVLLASLLAVALCVFLNRHIAVPLREVAQRATQISLGQIVVKPVTSQRSDEIGLLETQFNAMALSLQDKATLAKQIAGGDLSVQVKVQSEQDMLGNAFAVMVKNLREMTRELSDGVNVLAASASEILAGTTQIAASATETASAMAETATTVEEVKQTAGLSSQKARTVSESAQRATQVAQTGRKAVDESMDGMLQIRVQMESMADSIVRLSEQSQAIGEIVATVNDLSEQSNLLAVNASIEAAKAGDQGRGFAVVAQEVKSLAAQSRQATSQVRAILGDIQKATSSAVLATEKGAKVVAEGVRQARQAGDAIVQMTQSTAESAQAASQIAVSAQQQLAGMDQLALATDNIRLSTTQNMDSARQAEIAAHNLHELGQRLKHLIERYRL